MHATEIIGYHHPDDCVSARWGWFYVNLCKCFHLNPETKGQLDERLGACEDQFASNARIDTMSKKVLTYPETRQVYDFDCGANSLMSMLVFAGVEEREERIMKLAGTTKEDGTQTEGVLLPSATLASRSKPAAA